MKRIFLFIYLVFMGMTVMAQSLIETQRLYLSGHGCDDMVNWDFFCTDGRNSGKWTKIGVPSCWELQGFGTYQYGMRFYGIANPDGIANEHGKYKYEFSLPQSWEGKQIELVFEAVMTDAKVKINGRRAGNGLHQGGFYRFTYDVSDRIFFGKHKNVLEVEVSKESATSQVNMAERRADYWNFGGIFRPVFVVAKPSYNISRVAIDADMNGIFKADCFLNHALKGSKVKVKINSLGESVAEVRGDVAHFDFKTSNPKLWTAETPNIYTAEFSLMDSNNKVIHREKQKFGFRTIEYRQSDGVYINGRKVIFKGVNRHSFRPESGRTLSKAKNIEDVKLIKSMNMNAVRLSHYPADPEFLDACDSLGLYVESELSGWHWAHETVIGRQLVKEMVTRDVNHPSIIFWSNGNEGGFNDELEPEFARWDVQKRVVLYPWANRNGFETKHYRSYGETQEYMRQKEIFMPTEFLHGLYDGGHGAGLKDYWTMMMANPRCAGGFLWDLADEGVSRTDEQGIIDCQGNFGADGIVGPHFEKEGSYYTIKEVWSPVEMIWGNEFTLQLINHYDFTNLNQCKFSYRYLTLPQIGDSAVKVLDSGVLTSPDVAPGQSAILQLKKLSSSSKIREDGETKKLAIEITATDKFGREIFSSSQEVSASSLENLASSKRDETRIWNGASNDVMNNGKKNTQKNVMQQTSAEFSENAAGAQVSSDGCTYRFSKTNGRLMQISIDKRNISLSNGPRLVAARRSDRSYDQFYNHDDKDAEKKKTEYTPYQDHGTFAGFRWDDARQQLTVKYQCSSLDSVMYTFDGHSGVNICAAYNFGGVVDLMGIALDYPEKLVKSKSWVGNGPYRVWQNRLHGPQYGFWKNSYNDPIPGESWDYPEFKGYFAHVDWMQLVTDEGEIGISNLKMTADASTISPIEQHIPYVGIYTPRDGRDHLLYTLPETGLAVLRVIPAVRNKVNCTDLNGPSAQPKWLMGKGTIQFRLEVK